MKRAIALLLVLILMVPFAACGGKGEDVTGKYICVGESYFDEALEEPYEESWLELKKGGKGTYYSGFEFNLKWKLDGESFSGTVSFLGMEQAMEGTLKNGVIDVKYGDMNIRFVREGAEAPANGGADTGAANGAGTAAGGTTGANDAAVVADSIGEAFQGANPFVGVPDEVLTGDWYGWIRESECWGGHAEDFKAMRGTVGYNSDTGRKYIDLYKDGVTAYPEFSMWLEESEGDVTVLPDIGDRDAWVLDTFLVEEEESLFTTTIRSDGSLYFSYECIDEGGTSGCLVEIFLRKAGAAWDEWNDTLPPDYPKPVG